MSVFNQNLLCGSLAQLGEHLPYKQRVIGSSPIVSTTFQGESLDSYGLVVQLVRTPPCHGGGRGFESHPGRHYADLAHLVERHLAKVEVASSSLVIRSIALYYLFHCKAHKERSCVLYFFCGRRKRANSNPFAFDRNRLTLRHGT